jgi:glycerol-3-phosphate dehydrogenase
MGGRHILPATSSIDLRDDAAGQPLQDRFGTAFEYSDVWVEDSRLVALNARDAAARGATILTRTKVSAARREGALWQVTLTDSISGASHVVRARMLVNAAGPWVRDVIHGVAGLNSPANIRLVRGSHIVVPRFFDHEKCYFLQGTDGRIIFAIPYEGDFTLIGTTDADHPDATEKPVCSPAEAEYLLEFANAYFKQQLTADDIVWTYSGVRPLYDDGASSATAATRDYVLKLDTGQGAPMLNIFGGKITTYRRLAEAALDQIAAQLPVDQPKWTAGVPLPGGDFPVDGVAALIADLRARFAFLDAAQARRFVRAYGTDAALILDGATSSADLGPDFGAGLTGAEVRWLMRHEFARDAQDILWRRSKLGLRLTPDQVTVLQDWMSMQKP